MTNRNKGRERENRGGESRLREHNKDKEKEEGRKRKLRVCQREVVCPILSLLEHLPYSGIPVLSTLHEMRSKWESLIYNDMKGHQIFKVITCFVHGDQSSFDIKIRSSSLTFGLCNYTPSNLRKRNSWQLELGFGVLRFAAKLLLTKKNVDVVFQATNFKEKDDTNIKTKYQRSRKLYRVVIRVW